MVLNDPDVRMLFASAHYGDEDPVRIRAVLHRDPGSATIAHVLAQGVMGWTAPGHIPPAPELGLLGRLAVPVRWHGELLGIAMVIDEGSLTAAETALIEDFAQQAAGLITAERHDEDRRAVENERDVAAWLGRDPVERGRGHDALVARGLLPDLRHVRVFVAETPAPGAAEAPRTHLALRHAFEAVRGRFRGTSLSAVRDGRGALAIVAPAPAGPDEAGAIAAAVLADILDIVGRDRPVRVGIGAPVGDVRDAWGSRRQADLAARAVPLLDAGPVAHWDRLGALQLLARIPAEEMDATFVPEPVRALLAADPDGRLSDTLRQYLRSGGAGSATAAALHIHRTTLYYRLDRIRTITGLDIDDGDVRLQLQLGLLAERMQNLLAGPG